MTLQSLLYAISEYGIGRKIINYSAAGSSLYDLNGKEINNYPLLFTSPTGTHLANRNTTTYSITLYYIDRLLADSSNDISIFSTAIEQLKNIIAGVAELDGVVSISDEYSIQNFTDTEVLDDRCAGAFATIDITIVNGEVCPQE